MTHAAWNPIIGNTRVDLSNRMAELARAKDFFDKAMSQPNDGTGVQREAIDWLRSASGDVIDAYFAYLHSQRKQPK